MTAMDVKRSPSNWSGRLWPNSSGIALQLNITVSSLKRFLSLYMWCTPDAHLVDESPHGLVVDLLSQAQPRREPERLLHSSLKGERKTQQFWLCQH